MFSLQHDEELDRIVAGLASRGAVALLSIDTSPLERVERRFGGSAQRLAMDGLVNLVRDVLLETVPAADLLVTEAIVPTPRGGRFTRGGRSAVVPGDHRLRR